MATPILSLLSAALAVTLAFVWVRWREAERAQYIRQFVFPPGLFRKLQEKRPGLDAKQFQLVARALRQFFLAHLKSGRKFVSMPSQVADDLWHEFILYTRNYEQFCRRAFGRFLHHTPAVVLGRNRESNAGLRRTWWYVCLEENLNPRFATRLPLLFALDAKLGIADGFVYQLDCSSRLASNREAGSHCAADLGSEDVDGSLDGWFGDSTDGDGDAGCGGGCGGGD